MDGIISSGGSGSSDEERLKTLTLSLLRRLLPEMRTIAVRLWDGTTLPAAADPPRATLALRGPAALPRILTLPVDLSAGEAYLRGDFEVEGDLEAVVALVESLGAHRTSFGWLQLVRELTALQREIRSRTQVPTLSAMLRGGRHSRERDRQAVQHHYDVSTAFYKLWLDARMVYSCAYFPLGGETLDGAQEAKLDLICRKLRLTPGERLLDIGCGWGGLVIYAAQRYGVEALGVTLSEQQLEEARARVRDAGLEGRVRIEGLDYREIQGTFDKIASIGMAEHVGHENLSVYFGSAWERLAPGGLMLNHAISLGPRGRSGSDRIMSGGFIQRYVFPDGEIVPLWQMLRAAEGLGFEVRDVEDLREHYATTLRHWVANIEGKWGAAVAEGGLERARLWRLFMSASAYQFPRKSLAVHQVLLAKPDAWGKVEAPATRSDLYRTVVAGGGLPGSH